MSSFVPGKGAGVVLATTTTATTVAVLPQTGMALSVDLAIAALVGLVVWAVVYGIMAKKAQR
jgi:LPXTG-motif cell wall-anchored protein